MIRLAEFAASVAAVCLLCTAVAWSQDEVEPKVEPVLIDDVSPEAKARAEARAREREAEKAALGLPASPEAALAAALRNNPDILLADAKVRQAEAELNQVRLKTMQNVLVAYKQYETDKQMVARGEALMRSTNNNIEELLQARQALVESEAALRYLLGTPSEGVSGSTAAGMLGPPVEGAAATEAPAPREATRPGELAEMAARSSPARPPLSEELEAKLSVAVDCRFVDTPLSAVLEQFRDETGMVVVFSNELAANDHEADAGGAAGASAAGVGGGAAGGSPGGRGAERYSPRLPQPIIVNLDLGETSLKNVLTALNDKYGLAFVVRDYGLLVTPQDSAARIPGPAIPTTVPYRPN